MLLRSAFAFGVSLISYLICRIPCEKLPEHPLDISRMTDEHLHTELEKGYANMQAERTIPAAEAFMDIRKEYGI